MVLARVVNGERLAALRGKRSREWVAHELRRRGHATDAKAVWRWENSRNQPSARVLPDYADVLGVGTVDELYHAEEEEEDRLLATLAEAIEALREKRAVMGDLLKVQV